MRFGSLFAGIGGIDLGLERAGMECAWQVEIDEFCQKVLTKHWPNVPKYGDIRDVGKENLETVDLIAGGFPCQPFSVAGKQRGEEDDRHLWPEMLRVISELKPTWVLGENVPGIIPIFLDQAISDLEAEGYSCEPFVLPACAFDAPHRRDRLFVVAYRNESGHVYGQLEKQSAERGEYAQCKLEPSSEYEDVAHSERERWGGGGNEDAQRQNGALQTEGSGSGDQSGVLADTQEIYAQRLENGQGEGEFGRGSRWLPEPQLGRVAHGIPNRVDRLRGLGNAVVPPVAEFIGRMIMEADNDR